MADLKRAIRLLEGLWLMSPSTHWREEIDNVIQDLRGAYGLPKDDPLRFDNDGNLLSEEDLSARLQTIINSWEKPRYGRKKNYKRNRTEARSLRRR